MLNRFGSTSACKAPALGAVKLPCAQACIRTRSPTTRCKPPALGTDKGAFSSRPSTTPVRVARSSACFRTQQRCLGSATSEQETCGLSQLPTTGSSDALEAVSKLAQELGDRFFLVQCGRYDKDHPYAGQAALALVQLVLVEVTAALDNTTVADVVLAPQDCENAMLVVLAYQVDQQQRLTGAAFSSPYSFIKLTNKRHLQTPLAACSILTPGAGGQPVRLLSWYEKHLQPLGVQRIPAKLQHSLRTWAHSRLRAAGVRVLTAQEALSLKGTSSLAPDDQLLVPKPRAAVELVSSAADLEAPEAAPAAAGQQQLVADNTKYLGAMLLAQPRVVRHQQQQSSSVADAADDTECSSAGTSSSSSSSSTNSSATTTSRWHGASSHSSSSRPRAVTCGKHSPAHEHPSNSHLVAFTDGSCKDNGWVNGVGAYGVAWPHHPGYNTAAPLPGRGTSIRGELQAAIQACEDADIIDPGRTRVLIIYTDSMFLIKMMTEWVWRWARTGWRKADGLPIANPSLVKQLHQHAKVRDITFIKVKAHTGRKDWVSVWNAVADRLATRATAKEAARRKGNKKRHR